MTSLIPTNPVSDIADQASLRDSRIPANAWRSWAVAFAVSTGLYLSTMAPGVLWGDSGDAQVRVLTGAWTDPRDLARAHVSYYAAAWFVHAILGLGAAMAANAVAALAGAATVANVCVLTGLLTASRVAQVAGTALLLVSHTLWQLSSGAEVVTFSTMLVSAEVLFAVRFLQSGRGGWLVAATFANGLGWTTHNLSLLTWPAYALLLAVHWRCLPRVGGRMVAVAAVAWLAGVLPLLVLTVREYAVIGDAWLTLKSLFVGVYAEQVFHHRIDASQGLRVAAYVVWNFPTPVLLLAPWGWLALRRASGTEHRAAAPGVWLYLTVAAAMYALFGARYKVPDQYTFLVHAYLFVATFTAVGVARWCARYPSGRTAALVLFLSVIAPGLYAIAPRVARSIDRLESWLPAREIPYRDPYTWFLRPWRAGDDGAARFAHEVLATLPEGAVFYADSTGRRPIDYVQAADGLRHDVRIVGSRWRPREDRAPVDPASLDSYIANGLLYCLSDEPGYLLSALSHDRYGVVREGVVSRVVRTDEVP